jgi:hypothetical protein
LAEIGKEGGFSLGADSPRAGSSRLGIQEIVDVSSVLNLRSMEVRLRLEYFLRYYTSDLLAAKPAANKQVILMTKTLSPRFL